MTVPERDAGSRAPALLPAPPIVAAPVISDGLTGGIGPAHVLAMQRTSGNAATTRWLAAARSGHAAPRPHVTAQAAANGARSGLPSGGTPVNRVGVVDPADAPELHVRQHAKPDAPITARLKFGDRVQVIKQFPENWYYVSTPDGQLGYVVATFVRTHLPEPNARLHLVKAGSEGFAINIAKEYFGEAAHRGEDLRFFVNAIAWVNRKPIPKDSSGWKKVHFDAEDRIWVPSLAFAQSLRGTISTGSATWDVLDDIGIGGLLERTDELLRDLGHAIEASKRYLLPAIRHHVEQALWNVMLSLALMMIGAIAVMAIFTAAGAAIGGLATGGAGAVFGAEAGLELAQVFLDWLGLGFLLLWLGQAVKETGGAFAHFLSDVWGAHSDPAKLDKAARSFADAIGTLLGNLLEVAVIWVASIGVNAGVAKLRESRLVKSLGERFITWVEARARGKDEGVESEPPKVGSDGPATAEVRAKYGDHAVQMLERAFGDVHTFEQLAGNVRARTRPKGDTVETLRTHLERTFGKHKINDVMLDRMARIERGELKPEQVDVDFLQHEILEYELMLKGVPHDYEPLPGGRPGQQWTPAHDLTKAVLGDKTVYHPDAIAAEQQSEGFNR